VTINEESPEVSEPAKFEGEAQSTGFMPVVGIGASAGGLAAFEAFFSGMPANTETGMAYVLIQHLAPDHKSILTELVRRYTRMQVFEVEDGMQLQANCAYIIPPNHDMVLLNGALQLLEPAAPRGWRLPIDHFFQSLAAELRERAIGIVLAGTGSDGTLGARAIKAGGGMVMAQIPETTEFDGMSRSVIATGLVDYQLAPADMPAQLAAYVSHVFGPLPRLATKSIAKEDSLKKLFRLLRSQTTHDFSQYKPNTIQRRIERRMSVHQIDGLDNYVQYLQQTPTEVNSLFCDLLIGVTSFFRDPEVFDAIAKDCVPKLFEGKAAGTVIRIWCAGCSTGEEAYSLAILLQEQLDKVERHHTVQVFATDIDRRAIAVARAGVYPESIAADLTPERLARFFVAEPGGNAFRVTKALRDLLIFSEHDLLKDPPFSKLDLVSCRNLLIYLSAELQRRLIPLFHYALGRHGMLLLGTSEGVGDSEDLFSTLNRKAKLYQRQANRRVVVPSRPSSAITTTLTPTHPGANKNVVREKRPLRELTEQTLLAQIAPACALVNAEGDILYLHGRTGRYLEPSPGEAGPNNVLRMAREGLRRDLATALHQASRTNEVVRRANLRVKTNGDFSLVNLAVCVAKSHPLAVDPVTLYLVIFDDAPILTAAPPQPHVAPAVGCAESPAAEADAIIQALRDELRIKEEELRMTQEELETSTEELKSSNEEMQSINEELQSTNEELETSKEELQSVNEELATVNTELQAKVTDLSRTNNDMNNLLSGTGIATIFVDMKLCILRFTPTASLVINVIPSDVGRPLCHFASNLVGYDGLVADMECVLETLASIERDVQARDGKWYKMRMRPYRTLENVIEGAVVTFVDITEMERTRDALRKANESLRLAVALRDAHDAITVQDLEGRIVAWNLGAERLYGWTEAEALRMSALDRIPAAMRDDALVKIHRLSRAEVLEPYRTERLTKDGTSVEIMMTATALVNDAQQMYAIATTERALGSVVPTAVGGTRT